MTCGSPLHSLYVSFFPRYFDDSDFRQMRTLLGTRWSNAWRSTDPIASPFLTDESASPLPATGPDFEIDPALDYLGKLNRHSNYWTEPEQAEQILNLIAASNEAITAARDAGEPAGTS